MSSVTTQEATAPEPAIVREVAHSRRRAARRPLRLGVDLAVLGWRDWPEWLSAAALSRNEQVATVVVIGELPAGEARE